MPISAFFVEESTFLSPPPDRPATEPDADRRRAGKPRRRGAGGYRAAASDGIAAHESRISPPAILN
ncbi:hypothetical protein CK220_28305 [Mesorhizobium sp. WSM3860]|nr:hypothetical protein CK220_28305 [Mesorhizobium sp. WSM3860]